MPRRTHAAERTSSRRQRAGSSRNKRLRNVGSFASDLPPGAYALYYCDGSFAGGTAHAG